MKFTIKSVLVVSVIVNIVVFSVLLLTSRKSATLSVHSDQKNYTEMITSSNESIANISKFEKNMTLSNYIEKDVNLRIIKYNSKKFFNSDEFNMLKRFPNFHLYIMIEFEKPATYNDLLKLKENGFKTWMLPPIEYIGKNYGIFYTTFKYLKMLQHFYNIRNAYILLQYTAKGYYKINFSTEQQENDIELTLSIPISRPGKNLMSANNNLSGNFTLLSKSNDVEHLYLRLSTQTKGTRPVVSFYSSFYYIVSLPEILKQQIFSIDKVNFSDYRKIMLKKYPEIYETFTRENSLMPFTEKVKTISWELRKAEDIRSKYILFTEILDSEFPYNWQQRHDFFAGNLMYSKYQDLYMNFVTFESVGTGCCSERRPYETAVLRHHGIAARIATRCTHVYSEIFIPETGWVSTTPLLNEIPLNYAKDDGIPYFITWSSNIPGRVLVWEGALYPMILF